MAIELPLKKVAPATQDPKNLIIYGVPKIGKTTLLATLEDNLIIDFEDGSDYVEALKVKVKTPQDWAELIKALATSEHKYKFITVDTVTALEEFCKPFALQIYKKTPAGEKFTGTDVLAAPMGAGYGALRQAMEMVVEKLSTFTQNVILVGHVKDKSIVSAEGQEVGSIKDFDVSGKAGRILAAKSDGIAYIYRDKDSNLCLNFETGGIASAGARPAHLANKNIVVAERQENGTFTSHWERIYPSLATKK